MAYLAAKKNGAKDWLTGLGISQFAKDKTHKIEAHHIIPKSLLQKEGYEKSEINEIANMGFLGARSNQKISAKDPAEYLEGILAKRGEEALTSQFVPLDKTLWKVDRYRDFLGARRKLIIDAINEIIS